MDTQTVTRVIARRIAMFSRAIQYMLAPAYSDPKYWARFVLMVNWQ